MDSHVTRTGSNIWGRHCIKPSWIFKALCWVRGMSRLIHLLKQQCHCRYGWEPTAFLRTRSKPSQPDVHDDSASMHLTKSTVSTVSTIAAHIKMHNHDIHAQKNDSSAARLGAFLVEGHQKFVPKRFAQHRAHSGDAA